MYIKEINNKNNFNFYYVDTTYELTKLNEYKELSALSTIIVGRLLSGVILLDNILRNNYFTGDVIYEYGNENIGLYQIKVSQNKNISLFLEKPNLNTKDEFKNGEVDIGRIVNGPNKIGVFFSIFDEQQKQVLNINEISIFKSNYGSISEDLVAYLNAIGMSKVAVSLGVEVERDAQTQISCSGGFICHVYNEYQNENVIIQVRKDLNNSADIKTLQNKYQHADEEIIKSVLSNFEKFNIKITPYSFNSKQNQIFDNYYCLNQRNTYNDFILIGVDEEQKQNVCFWSNLIDGREILLENTNLDNFFSKPVKLFVSKQTPKSVFSGTSMQLGIYVWKRYQNPRFSGSGSIDVYGNVHYVANLESKIICANKIGLIKFYVPLENKNEVEHLLVKQQLQVKIIYVNSIYEL